MPVNKTLYILRHAKAEAGSATLDDHERGLNAVGIEACAVIGKYMARQSILPELVLCSTAKRAKDTWVRVKLAAGIKVPEDYTDRLYLASANEILKQLSGLAESFSKVMVVGHNPGLHQLSIALAKRGDEALIDTLALKFPTCALAAVEFGDATWSDVAQAIGTLQLFVTPKMLTGDRS